LRSKARSAHRGAATKIKIIYFFFFHTLFSSDKSEEREGPAKMTNKQELSNPYFIYPPLPFLNLIKIEDFESPLKKNFFLYEQNLDRVTHFYIKHECKTTPHPLVAPSLTGWMEIIFCYFLKYLPLVQELKLIQLEPLLIFFSVGSDNPISVSSMRSSLRSIS
jgi:hypothetical protein